MFSCEPQDCMRRWKEACRSPTDRIHASAVLRNTHDMLKLTQHTRRRMASYRSRCFLCTNKRDGSSVSAGEIHPWSGSYLTQAANTFEAKRIEWGVYMLQTNLQNALDRVTLKHLCCPDLAPSQIDCIYPCAVATPNACHSQPIFQPARRRSCQLSGWC